MPESVTKPTSGTVLKFNMVEDETIRTLSKKGHEVSKAFKTAGVRFKKIIPSMSDLSVRKQFRLGKASSHICIEIDIKGDKLQDEMAINDVKSYLMTLDNYRLIAENQYSYSANEKVYRFLILGDVNLPLPQEKIERSIDE